ncbi:glycine N-acyltransferase-like protein 3 [Periophthalmus magnuspinnatus]|uniref:glycine N-acyltransferase-like protein 3 n=1 Tax=Periophthalmus magnuspinnatus TaxID=409849 RepID=UPI0024374447|nr:glycine N-acyltransferase-like protein 3 [Periophthalmus magnuspinnatus]
MELTAEQVKNAKVKLKEYLPRSIKVHGYLLLMLRGQSDPVKVFVDQWPDFNVVVCKPVCKQEGDLFKDIDVFATSEATLKEVIRNSKVFDWSKFFCVGTTLDNRAIFKAAASEKHIVCRHLAVCHMMILKDVSKLPDINCAGISIGFLNESHIEIVNKTWKFGQKDALRMIQNMVRNFPSCCVFDAEGRPVSWVLTYACCSMGMLYTVPEHRGKGYAKVVISELARRLFTEGYPVYCFIEEGNTVSYELFKGLGFNEEEPTYRESWFDFTPNAK